MKCVTEDPFFCIQSRLFFDTIGHSFFLCLGVVVQADETDVSDDSSEQPWTPLTPDDLREVSQNLVHFNSKTVHSWVGDVRIRLPCGRPRSGLPYIALSVLGATHADLDFVGDAKAIRKPRQVKDVISGLSSGKIWTNVPAQDLALLQPDQPLEQQIREGIQHLPEVVPALLRQVIVPDAEGNDLVLTPVGGIGLSRQIMARLEKERQGRAIPKTKETKTRAKGKGKTEEVRRFWKTASNNLGGAKPQNIGLMCTVQGGPVLAGFAWYFPAPRFPSLELRKRFAVLFRRFTSPLGIKAAAAFRQALEAYEAHPGLSTERAWASLAKQEAKKAKRLAKDWQKALQDQLWQDVQKDRQGDAEQDGLPGTPSAAWTALWETGQSPESNARAWEYALSKPLLELGWLLPNLRTHAWAQGAAEELIGQWLAQMKIFTSMDVRQKLTRLVATEIMT